MKILVTGGAGYVGSILVPKLLHEGYEVVVFDNFLFNQTSLLDVIHNLRLTVVRGDVRDCSALERASRGVDFFIHLAGIVGAPACHQEPQVAYAVNVEAVKALAKIVGDHPFLFPSTGSCYGHVESGLCTEATSISPLSEYGAQKAQAEEIVHDLCPNAVIFRFATAFGASPRPRLDLLVNDLAYQAVTRKSLVIYEAAFQRTFVHVRDMANVFLWALSDCGSPEWRATFGGQVFNVGDESMNYTKAEIARMIVERVPGCLLNLAGEGKDPDARNYWVDYSKIKAAGFLCRVTMARGLDELFKSFEIVRVRNPFSNAG